VYGYWTLTCASRAYLTRLFSFKRTTQTKVERFIAHKFGLYSNDKYDFKIVCVIKY